MRGYGWTNRSKRDSGSNGWHRQRNECGSLMGDAFVHNMDDRSNMRNDGGKEDYKTLQMCTKKNLT